MDRREFLFGSLALMYGLSDLKKVLATNVDGIEIDEGLIKKAQEITIPNYTVKFNGQKGKERLINNGAGFAIGKKYFTVNHVYTHASKIGTGEFIVNGINLGLLGSDERDDVAVFHMTKSLENHFNDLSYDPNVELYEGQKIIIYGSPANYFFRNSRGLFKEGRVSYPEERIKMNNGEGFVRFEGNVEGGDSGSPVFDAQSGKILGAVSSRIGNSIGYFTHIANFEKFVKKV